MTLRPLAVASVVSLVALARPAAAEDPPPPPYPQYTAPVYMIVSFDDDFIVSGPHPSQTIVINVGSMAGGPGLFDTRFAVNQALTTIQFPDGRHDPTFEELSNNSATILGSFQTSDLEQIHMITPAPGVIPPDLQVAVFQASHGGALDALLVDEPFPTTEQIADVVAEYLPPVTSVTTEDVLEVLFNSGQPLGSGDAGASIVGEGEMFPHDPGSASLFHFKVKVGDDGTVTTDVCLRIAIDVHPNSATNPVNVKSKNGEVPIAILSGEGFDPADVVASSVNIGGVAPTKSTVSDKNGDGVDDVIYHWNVKDLVDAGVLSIKSTSITVLAELESGDCVIGTDAINPTKN